MNVGEWWWLWIGGGSEIEQRGLRPWRRTKLGLNRMNGLGYSWFWIGFLTSVFV